MSRFGAREGSFCELTAGMGIFKYAMKDRNRRMDMTAGTWGVAHMHLRRTGASRMYNNVT